MFLDFFFCVYIVLLKNGEQSYYKYCNVFIYLKYVYVNFIFGFLND